MTFVNRFFFVLVSLFQKMSHFAFTHYGGNAFFSVVLKFELLVSQRRHTSCSLLSSRWLKRMANIWFTFLLKSCVLGQKFNLWEFSHLLLLLTSWVSWNMFSECIEVFHFLKLIKKRSTEFLILLLDGIFCILPNAWKSYFSSEDAVLFNAASHLLGSQFKHGCNCQSTAL